MLVDAIAQYSHQPAHIGGECAHEYFRKRQLSQVGEHVDERFVPLAWWLQRQSGGETVVSNELREKGPSEMEPRRGKKPGTSVLHITHASRFVEECGDN